MDWKPVQKRLAVRDDGIAGPQTYTALFRFCGAKDEVADGLGRAAARYLQHYGISTPLRHAHFLAQAGHETGGFKWFTELWGPTPAQRGYEGRRDLGNTQPGDGYRYRGRGIFQLTGRANYAAASKRLGYDLINNPAIVASYDIAMLTACDYWTARGLSSIADRDDVELLTRRVNGGLNGFADRKQRLARAKSVLL